MFDIINVLFGHYGFKGKPLNSNGFFWEKSGREYWVVIKEDPDIILDKQEIYSRECKALCSDPALDKNLSMLVLWETDGKLDHEIFKKKKMEVEENQYYFKKYMLGYSRDELVQLKKKIGDKNSVEYIEKSLISKEIFDQYRDDPFTLKWYSLLYRIAIKVPFVQIRIAESEGLQSLFLQNEAALKGAEILSFNNSAMKILEAFFKNDPNDPKDIEAQKLFNALQTGVGGLDD